jgi:hypothetical protein
MSVLLNKTIEYVDNSFGEKKEHFGRTLYWVIQLKPDADEALQIAAYSHDIQRAFNNQVTNGDIGKSKEGFLDKDLQKIHQNDGGKIMREFLFENEASDELVSKVSSLIEKHEMGGNEEQNILKDADSISFFECNVDLFINNLVPVLGVKKIKNKLDWMFNRITSEKAKEIARPMYEEGIKKLDKGS